MVSILPENDLAKIDKLYIEFKKKHPEFNFEQDPIKDEAQSSIITMAVAHEMTRENIIHHHVMDVSHRKHFAWLIVYLKQKLRKIANPFIKILFVRQQRMNDLTVALAYNVASLEIKVHELEQKLDKKEVKIEQSR